MPPGHVTPEQRYLFDINGSLHLPDVLRGAELAAAREAVERYVTTPMEYAHYVDVKEITRQEVVQLTRRLLPRETRVFLLPHPELRQVN